MHQFFFTASQLAFQTTLLKYGFPCALLLSFSGMQCLLFSHLGHPSVHQVCIPFQGDKTRTVHNLWDWTILGNNRDSEMSEHLPEGTRPRQRLLNRLGSSSTDREREDCWILAWILFGEECVREKPSPSSPAFSIWLDDFETTPVKWLSADD